MTASRALAIGAVMCLFASIVHSQDRTQYRDYRLGNDLTSVAAVAKVPATAVKTLHQRPSLIQELEWRQPFMISELTTVQSDPVQRIVFSFYDNQLFRMVISYDRQRTNGLTDADMIESLSETYGAALRQPPRGNLPTLPEPLGGELGAPIAQWGNSDYRVGLYRSWFVSEFRVVVTSPRLEGLAETATREAARLDAREAPQRAIDRKNKDAEDVRVAQEKARLANKAAFKP